jgi:BirA family biotin operon repressor/biotin-[acetyl-CoA-carboxylase] ligase
MLKTFHFSTVTSTMDVARDLLKDVKAPFLVVADYQTAGRGRNSSHWHSLPEAFLGTFVFEGAHSVKPRLSLIFALEVLRLLDLSPQKAQVKWPNDLLERSTDKKFGGILIELLENYLLVGLGLNLYGNQAFGGLLNLRNDLDKQRLTTILADGFDNFLSTAESFQELPLKFDAYNYLKNKQIKFNNSEQVYLALGITDEGGLIVKNQLEEQQVIFSAFSVKVCYG